MLKRPRIAYYFANKQDKSDVSLQMEAVAEERIPSDETLGLEFGDS